MAGWFGQSPASTHGASSRRRRALWLAFLATVALVPAGAVVWTSARHGNGAPHGEIRGDGNGTREEDANASTGCGSGSTWNVKIGADPQAGQINQTPVSTTVAWLTSQAIPSPLNHRAAPIEFTTYTVTATLTNVYQEHDLDMHMSIDDGQGHFMLVELPDSSCDQGSIFTQQFNKARTQLANGWAGHARTVQITGVGFFDNPTGQSDQAPNHIELHPVLDINFSPGGPATGSIGGTVTDRGGAPLNGASIATSPSSSTGHSNATGQYAIAGVTPGSYTATASAPKFMSQTDAGVTVAAGSIATANFALTPVPLPPAQGGPYWSGWDIARGVALLPDESGGYVLDGFGGLHPFASTGKAPPPVVGNAYWPHWDIARGVALLPDGSGGYVVDGLGGIHPFAVSGASMPPPVTATAYWSGWDIVRGITLLPNGNGYVLDGFGGMHPFRAGGSWPPAVNGAYWAGRDIGRGIVATGSHGGYLVDAFGGVHTWATATSGATPPPGADGGPFWGSWNIARGIAGAGYGPGPVRGYVLDGFGGLGAITLWPAP